MINNAKTRSAFAAIGLIAAGSSEAAAVGAHEQSAQIETTTDPVAPRNSLLTANSTIGELLDHPDLRGIARRILPWADRPYGRSMTIGQISQLLPYHSQVNTGDVLAGVNRIIADQRAGKPVFHEIYSPSEQAADPALNQTGLFFFAGHPGAPFAIVAPGGGFSYVGSVHEGFPYTMEIAAKGLNAFVLTYRTGQGGRVATQDLARAVDYVMDHAEELQVSRDGYSLWGSSAGARMAASIGSHGPDTFGARTTLRPSTVVMAYTSHADVGTSEPPTYVVVGGRDGIAPPGNMESRVQKLHSMNTPTEFHIFPTLGHGFGSGTGTEAEGWIGEAVDFWKDQLATAPKR